MRNCASPAKRCQQRCGPCATKGTTVVCCVWQVLCSAIVYKCIVLNVCNVWLLCLTPYASSFCSATCLGAAGHLHRGVLAHPQSIYTCTQQPKLNMSLRVVNKVTSGVANTIATLMDEVRRLAAQACVETQRGRYSLL